MVPNLHVLDQLAPYHVRPGSYRHRDLDCNQASSLMKSWRHQGWCCQLYSMKVLRNCGNTANPSFTLNSPSCALRRPSSPRPLPTVTLRKASRRSSRYLDFRLSRWFIPTNPCIMRLRGRTRCGVEFTSPNAVLTCSSSGERHQIEGTQSWSLEVAFQLRDQAGPSSATD